jgi:hypothetical protein
MEEINNPQPPLTPPVVPPCKENGSSQAEELAQWAQILAILKTLMPDISNLIRGVKPSWHKYLFDFLIVVMVITPITILGWKGVLTENTLGTLFGGIIGYVLAKFKRNGG